MSLKSSRYFSESSRQAKYLFTLKDLWSTVSGFVCHSTDNTSTVESLQNLAIHQCESIYRRRLDCSDDRIRFDRIHVWTCETNDFLPECVNYASDPRSRHYVQLATSYTQVDRCVLLEWFATGVEKYTQWNHEQRSASADQHFVPFGEALGQVAFIRNALLHRTQHLILSGAKGTGRRTCAYVAGASLNYQFFEYEGPSDLHLQELKDVLTLTGIAREPLVLYVEPDNFTTLKWLHTISQLVRYGKCMEGTFTTLELENITSRLRNQMEFSQSRRGDILEAFFTQVRNNLRVIVAVSTSSVLNHFCDTYSSIRNDFCVLSFQNWDVVTVEQVYDSLMCDWELYMDPQNHALAFSLILYIHDVIQRDVAHLYLNNEAPLSQKLQNMIKEFQTFYGAFQFHFDEVEPALGEALDGILIDQEYLEEQTGEEVDFNERLHDVVTQRNVLAEELNVETERFAALSAELGKDEIRYADLNMNMEQEKLLLQVEVEKTLPEFYEAIKEINKVEREDITEMKNTAAPPDIVRLGMQAVCILLRENTTWPAAQKLLGNAEAFLNKIRQYDKDSPKAHELKALRKVVKTPGFSVAVAENTGVAILSIVNWVIAIRKYRGAKISVAGKHSQQAPLLKTMKQLEMHLKETTFLLENNRKLVMRAGERYKESERKATCIREEAHDADVLQGKMEEMMTVLEDIQESTEKKLKKVQGLESTFIGNALLQSAVFTYWGPLRHHERLALLKQWKTKFNMINMFCTDFGTLIHSWQSKGVPLELQSQGLPNDSNIFYSVWILRQVRKNFDRGFPVLFDPYVSVYYS